MKNQSKRNSRHYSDKFILTDTGFTEKRDHFLKSFNVLKAIYKNNVVSKWDLAKIGNKEGYVPYSWVLVHKLMNELQTLSLIEPRGIRKVTSESRKKGKKHDTPTFGITKKGLVFLLMLDKKTFESYFTSNIEQKKTDDPIWSLCRYIWDLEYITPNGVLNYNIPIRSRVIELMLDTNNADVEIENILIEGFFYNVVDTTKHTIETLTAKDHLTIDTIKNLVYLLNIEDTISGIKFHNENLHDNLTNQLLAKILVLELHQEIMKMFWSRLTHYDWPSVKPIIETRNAILKSIGELGLANLLASIQRRTIYDLSNASKLLSPMPDLVGLLSNKEDNPTVMKFEKENKLKDKIIDDFQKAISTKNMQHIVNYLTSTIKVEVNGVVKFSGNGIQFVKQWIDTLPSNVKIIDSGILFDIITSLVRTESKNEIIIYKCHMKLRREKITGFETSIEKSRDLKYERKILNFKIPSSDKYAKNALSILQQWYGALSPKY